MRSRVSRLHLELEYAQQCLEQARIALAQARWAHASIAVVDARRQAVRERKAYVQLVRHDYEAAVRHDIT